MPGESVLWAPRTVHDLQDPISGAVSRRSPLIYVQDDFVAMAETDAVLEAGDRAEQEAWDASKHDATGFSVELPITQPALGVLAARVDDVVGLDTTDQPTARFRRYRAGEWHGGHVDHYEIGGRWLLVTAMVTLIAPREGGATRFDLATPPVRIPSRQGRLTLWVNHLRDGTPDRLATHTGEVVGGGEKATITRFLYASPAACHGIWERLGA